MREPPTAHVLLPKPETVWYAADWPEETSVTAAGAVFVYITNSNRMMSV